MGTVGLFICVICLGCSALLAEDAAAKPLDVETVLKNWHERISEYQGVKGTFVRTTYDNVFEMQKLSKGTFNVNRSGEAAYCWDGHKPENPRLKTGKDGKPYILEADQDEAWYWVNSTIIQVNKSNSTFDRIRIPKDLSDEPEEGFFGFKFYPSMWKEFWLSRPYLLGMPPEELQQRFEISIEKQMDEKVQLKFRPKEQRDLVFFSEASLILDLKTYLPYALKTVDPPGSKEIVHLFSNVEGIQELERISKPDLTLYKPTTHDENVKPRKRKKKKSALVAVESETDLLGTLYIAPLSMGETSASEW